MTHSQPASDRVSHERRTDFTAPKGGVMTDEVGAITGELTLRTEVDGHGTVSHRIQYKDAEEWYTVTGLPATQPESEAGDAAVDSATAPVAGGGTGGDAVAVTDALVAAAHAQALSQVSKPAETSQQ